MEFTKQYLTYEEYQELGGTLEETPFDIVELEAQKSIDKYTFGRLKDLEEHINNSLCEPRSKLLDERKRDTLPEPWCHCSRMLS